MDPKLSGVRLTLRDFTAGCWLCTTGAELPPLGLCLGEIHRQEDRQTDVKGKGGSLIFEVCGAVLPIAFSAYPLYT